jgi:hypothetical protein
MEPAKKPKSLTRTATRRPRMVTAPVVTDSSRPVFDLAAASSSA